MSGDLQIFQAAMNQGHTAAWDLEWEKAASYYKQAVDEFPEDIYALISLALALFELQKYTQALEYYQRAAKLSPNDPLPWQKVAEIFERIGDLEQGAKAYMDVAEVYARNKDVEKAIRSWSRVVAINPEHVAAHSRLAFVYERLGRNSEAIAEYITLASVLQNQGNIQKAVQTVKHALQLVPNSREANQALAILQSGKSLPRPGRPHGGTAPLIMSQVKQGEAGEQIKDDQPKLDPIQGAKQKALTALAELLFDQEEAQNPQARKGLSSIIRGMGDLGKLQYDQTKIILHLSQAIDQHTQGDDSHAALQMERAVEAGLDNSAAHYVLGFLQAKTDQADKAIENLRKSEQHEVYGLGARLLLALTLYKKESIKEASIEYLEALRIADAEGVPADQAEELMQLYEPLIESYSSQADAKSQKRICENISKMLIRPDWKDQIKLARQQLPGQADGSTPIPLAEMLTEATSSLLVESLAKVSQLERANKLLSAMEEAYFALKFAPAYLPLHECIGDLLVKENRLPEAIQKYRIVARSYSVRGEANRAIHLLRRVSDLAPTDLDTKNSLIELLIARGKIPETIQEFLKMAETYYSLADLAMARKTYSRALRFAQQFNVGRETKLKLMHRMADIDMQSLDWRSAIGVYDQVCAIDPDDAKARDMLFDLNIRLGQSSQAINELDKYLNHLLSVHRAAEGLEYLNTKIHENQNQPGLYRRLAEFYRLLGRKDEAINELVTAKELFQQADNRSAAVECVMAILALNPADANVYQRMLVELKEAK